VSNATRGTDAFVCQPGDREGVFSGHAARAIAIDIGGAHAACAVVESVATFATARVAIQDASSIETHLPAVADAVRRVLERSGTAASDCVGVALSFPGIVDSGAGRILSTPQGKYADARELDLALWCRTEFSLPLRIENDARMALLGERFAGAARGCDDIVMMTLGTGVGAAAMVEGRLIRGKHFQGGCLGGHLPVVWNGRQCICGNVGCVEAEASTWALPEICACWPQYAESALAREPRIDFETLFRCAREGDAAAGQIRERCVRIWAAGIVGLIHAYDPERVLLGGAVMGSADDILPTVREHVRAHAWTPWGEVEICAGELGSDAALLGAIPLLSETC
jgi:glucokinase